MCLLNQQHSLSCDTLWVHFLPLWWFYWCSIGGKVGGKKERNKVTNCFCVSLLLCLSVVQSNIALLGQNMRNSMLISIIFSLHMWLTWNTGTDSVPVFNATIRYEYCSYLSKQSTEGQSNTCHLNKIQFIGIIKPICQNSEVI